MTTKRWTIPQELDAVATILEKGCPREMSYQRRLMLEVAADYREQLRLIENITTEETAQADRWAINNFSRRIGFEIVNEKIDALAKSAKWITVDPRTESECDLDQWQEETAQTNKTERPL